MLLLWRECREAPEEMLMLRKLAKQKGNCPFCRVELDHLPQPPPLHLLRGICEQKPVSSLNVKPRAFLRCMRQRNLRWISGMGTCTWFLYVLENEKITMKPMWFIPGRMSIFLMDRRRWQLAKKSSPGARTDQLNSHRFFIFKSVIPFIIDANFSRILGIWQTLQSVGDLHTCRLSCSSHLLLLIRSASAWNTSKYLCLSVIILSKC